MHPNILLDSATELLRAVLRFDHPADAVVQRELRALRAAGPRERALLADAVYAVLRRRRLFEHLAASGEGAKERRLALLGLGFSDPAWLERFSALPGDAAQGNWAAAALRTDPATLPEACRHNLPDWLANDLQAQVGEEFWPLADALLQPAPLDVRINMLKEKRSSPLEDINSSAIKNEVTRYSPWGLRLEGKPSLARLEAYQRGAIEVQDEGSQLLALLLDARRGDMVADFCAGAGGKTLAIGAVMRNTGRLYAFDTSAHRLQALQPRLAKSGLTNVYPTAIAHEDDARLARLAGKMDRVLVDAPCSGLGTLRRSPDLKWRQSPAELAALPAREQAILAAAARLVKPGGRLVYATCSLLVPENEAVAQAFGAAHGDFTPAPVVETLTRLRVPEAASLCSADGAYLRLWPHRHDTDGFFAAAWTKK